MYTYLKKIGNKIYSKENGEVYASNDIKPFIFLPSKAETGYKSFPEGINLQKVEFNSIEEFKNEVDQYPSEMIYGKLDGSTEVVQYINQNNLNKNYDLSKLDIMFYDIEVFSETGFPHPEVAEHVVPSVVFKSVKENHFYVFTLIKNYKKHLNNLTLHVYDTEYDMFEEMFKFINKKSPDIISGWYSKFFDDLYIVTRAKRLGVDLRLPSKFNKFAQTTVSPKTGVNHQSGEFVGILFLDLQDLYKKYSYNQRESYSLSAISQLELNDDKMSYEDDGTLDKLLINNPQKYVEYNVQDVELLDKINKKLGLIETAFSLCYFAGADIHSYVSNTKLWDILLYNRLLEKNLIVHPKPKNVDKSPFIGAFVKEPQKGLKKWIVSFDLNSLYPHLIAQYNISPDTKLKLSQLPNELMKMTIREMLRNGVETNIELMINEKIDFSEFNKHNISVTPNGACFDNSKQGIVPEIMMELYVTRKKHKKLAQELKAQAKDEQNEDKKNELLRQSNSYDSLQLAEKIFLNSGYGFFTYVNSRFYDREIAEAITSSGQLSNRYCDKKITEKINRYMKSDNIDYVVYGDTDSLYVDCQCFVDKIQNDKKLTNEQIVEYLDNISKKVLEKDIANIYDQMSEYVSCYENKMVMTRENICESGFWVAKKKYVLNVWDSEGYRYDSSKFKAVGIQIKRSDTPKIAKSFLETAIKQILKGEYIDNIITDARNTILKSTPEEIAITKSVSDIEKYYIDGEAIRGTPQNVKASIFYNQLLAKHGITHLKPISSGEKVKILYLKPNPLMLDVIGFSYKLPEEFGLHCYVDYETMFDKIFGIVINDISNNAGIEIIKKIQLW